MTSHVKHEISYDSMTVTVAPGLDIGDLTPVENWEGRPASKWSVQRIGKLQSYIEQWGYQSLFRNSNSNWKHLDLFRRIPKCDLLNFMNKSFGYDGWQMEIINVKIVEARDPDKQSDCYSVVAIAEVRVSLKDSTNTYAEASETAASFSKAEAFSRAKKSAVTSAFKKSILNFESIVLDHGVKVEEKYYINGLYKK